MGDGEAATAAQLYLPGALALDWLGNMFVADTGTQRVRRVRDGVIGTLAGTGTAGSAGLNNPMGVAMDRAGNVLVADTFNHRVLTVTPAGVVTGLAGTGKAGVSPEGTAPMAAQLLGPRGVCTDLAGNVYIVDSGNHRVLRLTPGGVLQTAAGNGSKGSAGDQGVARLAQLNTPSACATDSAGSLYIADTGNHAIRKVTAGGCDFHRGGRPSPRAPRATKGRPPRRVSRSRAGWRSTTWAMSTSPTPAITASAW